MRNLNERTHVGYIVDDFYQPLNHFVNAELKYVSRQLPVTVFSLRRKEVVEDPDLAGLPCHYLGNVSVAKELPRSMLSGAARGLVLPISAKERAAQLVLARHIAKLATKSEVTHLHAHWAGMPASLGYLASRISGIPYSFTGHASDMFVNRYPSLLIKKIMASAFTVTISRYNRFYLMGLGIPPDKIKVVHCGVDPEKFGKPLTRRSRNEESYRILSLGRLIPKKGFDVLLEAFKMLRSEGVNLTLRIVGEGFLRPQLESMIGRDGLEGVHLDGRVSDARLMDLYDESDLFVLACREVKGDMDGIPVSLMEAMSRGLPAVSCGVSGIPELINPGRTGFLAEPDRPEALAQQVRQAIEDPRQTYAVSLRGREAVLGMFNARRSAGELARLFSSSHDNV